MVTFKLDHYQRDTLTQAVQPPLLHLNRQIRQESLPPLLQQPNLHPAFRRDQSRRRPALAKVQRTAPAETPAARDLDPVYDAREPVHVIERRGGDNVTSGPPRREYRRGMESTRGRLALDHRRPQTRKSRQRRGVFDPGSEEAVTGGMAGEVDGGGTVWGPGGFEGGVCEGEDG
ncbi:hypothetical protein BTJ68_13839 [Hortaea werneckii EXF-2000]|uniref:Uncharacterized protein n=1 Tax=Hortaea werneckii EXF-2000 TaxID=1157616 RepID=A0A1Z5SQN2_HORWE|nr:hypothetical protein BTJ68_13839 [Hortaea werneckii EXF-2000]